MKAGIGRVLVTRNSETKTASGIVIVRKDQEDVVSGVIEDIAEDSKLAARVGATVWYRTGGVVKLKEAAGLVLESVDEKNVMAWERGE